MDLDGVDGRRGEQSHDIIAINPPERRFRYFNQLGNLRVTDHPRDRMTEAKPPQNEQVSERANERVNERVIVCIDGANLFYAATSLNLEIDYAKLLRQIVGGRSLIRAYFYTGVDPTNAKQRGFLLWMRRNGYRVVTRDVVSLPSGAKSANLDVEIAVDMMQLAEHCDTMVLLSGDGDLAYAVERASNKGARFEVISLRSMTSEALLNVADQYVDLADLVPCIEKASNYHAPKGRSPQSSSRTIATAQNYPPEQGFALG